MTERGQQLRTMLQAMATNADLVADAFEGTVSGGDAKRNAEIEKLTQLNVLKPYDEDSYRLNPRFREFLADYFNSYSAFQALRMVSGVRQQARQQWDQLRRLKKLGKTRDMPRIFNALDESIAEISYSIEHNLTMLHSLISTQYGNVSDLSTKLQQNIFYTKQVRLFLEDVKKIDAFVDDVTGSAIAEGMPDVRQLLVRRLSSRLLPWTSQIKDAQAQLNKRMFDARQIEIRQRRLSRFALWLDRNRTADGWDLPVDANVNPSLLRTEEIPFRPQVDVRDFDDEVQQRLQKIASALPKTSTVKEPPPDHGVQMIIEEDEELLDVKAPEDAALDELIAEIEQHTNRVSLVTWKQGRPDLSFMSDEFWILYAGLNLKRKKKRVEFTGPPNEDPFDINEAYDDAFVSNVLMAA